MVPHGHLTNTALDTRLRPVTGLHHPQPVMHLRRRCCHRPDPTDHPYRRLPWNPTGALHSFGHSQALQAHFLQPGEFPRSYVLSDWSSNSGSVGGSYLPAVFIGQPVGIEQVGDVWIGDSGATSHMSRSADLMYDTRLPPPHRSRIILDDGSIKTVHFIGKIDLVFHSRTDYPVTFYDVPLVSDLAFNLFSFYIVQGKHDIILNETGAHLLDGRLVFPRSRCNRSSLHATRLLPGGNANASTVLATFAEPPSRRLDRPASPLPNFSVASPVVHRENSGVNGSCRARNAATGTSEKKYHVPWGMGAESESMSRGNGGRASAVLSPGGVFKDKKKKKYVVDSNHFLHVSLARAHSSVSKATTQQHDVQQVGELTPCSGCSMAKGICASTRHHITSRAAAPMDTMHIDTAGSLQESLGGSRCVVTFLDSASRFQRPYRVRDKSRPDVQSNEQFCIPRGERRPQHRPVHRGRPTMHSQRKVQLSRVHPRTVRPSGRSP